jgi:hypothetical protein
MTYAMRLLVSLAALAGFASIASARPIGGPSPGLWYDALESGRGYDIDLQGDTMIVSTYVYDANHNPIWYLSSGTYNAVTGVFSGTYDSYSGGQCFGCEYTAPTAHVGAAGPITITFYTNQSATITYPGGSSNIVKFAYGFPTRTDVLYGEWALSYNIGGTIGGDWVVFDSSFTDSTGAIFVKGHAAGASTTTALGIYDPNYSEAQVSVTEGTTTRFYEFGVFDDRRAIGKATLTVQGSADQGPYVATGARLLYKTEVINGVVIGEGDGANDAPGMVFFNAPGTAAEAAPADTAAIRAHFARARAELEASGR